MNKVEDVFNNEIVEKIGSYNIMHGHSFKKDCINVCWSMVRIVIDVIWHWHTRYVPGFFSSAIFWSKESYNSYVIYTR